MFVIISFIEFDKNIWCKLLWLQSSFEETKAKIPFVAIFHVLK